MGFSKDFAYPTASYGYYRGPSIYGGEGAGKAGQNVSGSTQFAQGQGAGGQASGWEPSILYLLIFVFVEMIVFGILAKKL
jgi:hypothetical protein